jgi:hypothetical protein
MDESQAFLSTQKTVCPGKCPDYIKERDGHYSEYQSSTNILYPLPNKFNIAMSLPVKVYSKYTSQNTVPGSGLRLFLAIIPTVVSERSHDAPFIPLKSDMEMAILY